MLKKIVFGWYFKESRKAYKSKCVYNFLSKCVYNFLSLIGEHLESTNIYSKYIVLIKLLFSVSS